MKKSSFTHAVVFLLIIFMALPALGQKHNTKGGFGAEGYDVVAYFSDKVEKGNSDFTAVYKGVNYRFSSKEHLKKFEASPAKYVPQYGGWCAYAMGKDGSQVSINPNTYEIIDGKLYLFYNSFGINTLKKWNEENPENLKKSADTNWINQNK